MVISRGYGGLVSDLSVIKVASSRAAVVREYQLTVPLSGNAVRPVARFNGTAIVQRSIELGEPVVYVSLNYRYVLFF